MLSGGPKFCYIGWAEQGQILTLTLKRPEMLNALNRQAHKELSHAFDYFSLNPTLRVAIVTGSGERAFCVGTDLKERAARGGDDMPATGFGGLTRRFDLEKPVIAAVNGYCLGGGLELALAADMIVAADHAMFGLPEPRAGLAASEGLHRLAKQIPLKQAMQVALTGTPIDAARAKAIGLVNEVVPRTELMSTARALGAQIVLGAPLSIEATKQMMMQGLMRGSLQEAFKADYPAFDRMIASSDANEGICAFNEKRSPVWKGK